MLVQSIRTKTCPSFGCWFGGHYRAHDSRCVRRARVAKVSQETARPHTGGVNRRSKGDCPRHRCPGKNIRGHSKGPIPQGRTRLRLSRGRAGAVKTQWCKRMSVRYRRGCRHHVIARLTRSTRRASRPAWLASFRGGGPCAANRPRCAGAACGNIAADSAGSAGE
jgi:hypothetical protein